MFIKLCGFTRIEDIEIVADLPVSSVGFIFYKNSKRYVTPNRAKQMSLILKGSGIKTTGVFVDDDPESILKIIDEASLDMVQLYSSDTADKLSQAIPVIRCSRIKGQGGNHFPVPLPGEMILFDTYTDEAHGGTGKSFSLDLIRDYPHKDKMIIAGGINENNVTGIIREIRPGGIDISSGIETSPGIKSEEKILKILKSIKEAENVINA